MGGRPESDGPDTVEELMRNTRNNPLEDLGMHLPLICDRYEVRDDVLPGAGQVPGRHGRGEVAALPDAGLHHPRGGPARRRAVGRLRRQGGPRREVEIYNARPAPRDRAAPGEVLRPAHRRKAT